MSDQNQKETYTLRENISWNLKRLGFELFVIFTIFSLIFFVPSDFLTSGNPKLGIISLFISKFLFVSAGALHAHLIRKLFFPYINFDKEEGLTSNAVLVIAIYVMVIFAWSRGG